MPASPQGRHQAGRRRLGHQSVEERVGEDLDRIGVKFQRQVRLASERGNRLAGTGCSGTDCTPEISGAAAFITTMVEMPAGASSCPRRTVALQGELHVIEQDVGRARVRCREERGAARQAVHRGGGLARPGRHRPAGERQDRGIAEPEDSITPGVSGRQRVERFGDAGGGQVEPTPREAGEEWQRGHEQRPRPSRHRRSGANRSRPGAGRAPGRSRRGRSAARASRRTAPAVRRGRARRNPSSDVRPARRRRTSRSQWSRPWWR
jgi:hypothetical protein